MPKHPGKKRKRKKKRKKKTKTQRILQSTFHEVKHNEPKAVRRTRRKKGAKAAKEQKTAIALDKARKKGARIKKKPRK